MGLPHHTNMNNTAHTIPILTFYPVLKQVLWGGTRIAGFKGLDAGLSDIGESWELSALPERQSVAKTPPFTGLPLCDIMNTHSVDILGKRLAQRFGNEFPLLVKFIDAQDFLSVQVHPGDDIATTRHGSRGKTEMWVTLENTPGAMLYAGFADHCDATKVRDHIKDVTLLDLLQSHSTHPGDVFYLPAGCVHSLGKGNLVLEIQQTSDVTYRLYDYHRTDAKGRQRELHIEEALAALDFHPYTHAVRHIDFTDSNERTIIDCPYFTASTFAVDGSLVLDTKRHDSFTILVNIGGDVNLTDAYGRITPLPKGSTALIPASMPSVNISGKARLVSVYIS